MPTVYRFRVTFEDYDEVTRDIEIKSTQFFSDLHACIQSSIGFDNLKPSSFYMSNDNWIKGQEISTIIDALEENDLNLDENYIRTSTRLDSTDDHSELPNNHDTTRSNQPLRIPTRPHRIRATKISRTAAFQSFLYCTSTFFVAAWVFLPWLAAKRQADMNVKYFLFVMTNLINPSQGIFNLFIYVRLEYYRLRTKVKLSRYESLKRCLFSPNTT